MQARLLKGLSITALSWLAGCSHAEHSTREMSWSLESHVPGMRALPDGAVRLTFVQAPEFHVGLLVPGLIDHLQASGKKQIPVSFEIQCKHRRFSLIRIRSVDGLSVETRVDNMWLESSILGPRQASGPFPDACRY